MTNTTQLEIQWGEKNAEAERARHPRRSRPLVTSATKEGGNVQIADRSVRTPIPSLSRCPVDNSDSRLRKRSISLISAANLEQYGVILEIRNLTIDYHM